MSLSHRIKPEHRQFALAGILGLAIDVLALYLCLALGAGAYLGRALSFLCAVFATWQYNRQITFRSKRTAHPWREWWHYLLAMSGGGILNYATYSLLTWQLPSHWLTPLLAVACGSLAGMIFNFCAAKWFVFR